MWLQRLTSEPVTLITLHYLKQTTIGYIFGMIRIWIQDQFFHFSIWRKRAFRTLNSCE